NTIIDLLDAPAHTTMNLHAGLANIPSPASSNQIPVNSGTVSTTGNATIFVALQSIDPTANVNLFGDKHTATDTLGFFPGSTTLTATSLSQLPHSFGSSGTIQAAPVTVGGTTVSYGVVKYSRLDSSLLETPAQSAASITTS